mmetsp:Transcript_94937/g.306504  ORF Transcript_94937/g.306504 Transcript_94937/m.306504 type:complete len:233 (+) Transcript_94937:175-873(+)
MSVARRKHWGSHLPIIQLRSVELGRAQHLTMLTATNHDGVAEDAAPKVHPGRLHALAERPGATGLRAVALQAAVHALVLVRAAQRVEAFQAVAGLPSRSHLDHVGAHSFPAARARVVALCSAEPRAARAAQDPEPASEGGGGRRGAGGRHRLQRHPALHPRIESLDVAQYLRAVEAAKGVDAAIEPRRCTIPPWHVQVRTGHPRPPQAIEALRLAECLVLQVLATEKVEPRV